MDSRRPSLPVPSSEDEKSQDDVPVDPQGNRHPSMAPRADGKRELREWECWDKLAYSWPKWKKAMYLASIAGIQISMNFNTSVYPSAVVPISEHFGISEQAARVGQMIYLVMYSFGCELWAPWSEEFGRWPILQLSMFLINIWEIPCSVAPNFGTIVVCRALVSLSPAPNVLIAILTVIRVVFPQQEVASRLVSSQTCTSLRRNTGRCASSYYPPLLEPVLVVSLAVLYSAVSIGYFPKLAVLY
jgi:MFS family permease